MVPTSQLQHLVDSAYEQRKPSWTSAAERIKYWIESQAKNILDGQDLSRITVTPPRIKEASRALDKLRRKVTEDDLEISDIEGFEDTIRDLAGLKVLCKSPRDQALIYDALRDSANLGSFSHVDEKDYVSDPKDSGYRACHVLLKVQIDSDGGPVIVEVQIKTLLQHAWGELTHEDMYKPGAAMKPSSLHQTFARTMADLLAAVDDMGDQLATELSAMTNPEPDDPSEFEEQRSVVEDTIQVKVRTTGPKYALAVDAEGRQGLIPAYVVRNLAGESGMIDVSDYVDEGDLLRVEVDDSEKGLYYKPVALA